MTLLLESTHRPSTVASPKSFSAELELYLHFVWARRIRRVGLDGVCWAQGSLWAGVGPESAPHR